MTRLRDWQRACIDGAMASYGRGRRDFIAVATPGAGKTTMASVLCQHLLESNAIDLVLCLTPSVAVAQGFETELARRTGCPMSGGLGAVGQVMTYQALPNVPLSFWHRLSYQRVLVIFDEMHHCAGRQADQANAWGAAVLARVQHTATYTLSLSGTPWRTDAEPVTLAHYDQTDRLRCDYVYSLQQAIADGVCRRPNITLIDNSQLRCQFPDGTEVTHTSIEALLSSQAVAYQRLLECPELVGYLLQQAVERLTRVRCSNPNAGALVVASSIAHAHHLQSLLRDRFGTPSTVVTHQDPDAPQTLAAFRQGHGVWLISVGMVSEGTDIPRLQVCAYLSRITTELYFRQVLGRIMRDDGSPNRECYFYTLAAPTLRVYADRLAQDLPDDCVHVNLAASPGGAALPLGARDTLEGCDAPVIEAPRENVAAGPVDPEVGVGNPADTAEEHAASPTGTLSMLGQYLEQLIEWEQRYWQEP